MKKFRFLGLVLIAVMAPSLIAATPRLAPLASIPPALRFTPVVTGVSEPVFITNAADGSNRLFIVQQSGQIRIFKNGSLLPAAFLNVAGVPNFTATGGEQGLLGLAFDPDYATNRFFYVTYTTTTSDPVFKYTTTLARYQASASNGDLADPATRTLILSIPKKYVNHNGGMIAFGPDTFLYMSMGDGGSGGDPDNNGQNIHTLLGKILRLDVHSTPPAGKTYAIPPTNPFFGNADPAVRQEIWAYGLRNPWRFSFDRSTGDLFIGDVGQNVEEEIDFQPASDAGGENYGWHILEGNCCYSPASNCTPPSHYVGPVAVYDHGNNDLFGCAVTGGYVDRDPSSPSLNGVYFYGDYCSGRLLGLVHNSNNTWTSRLITDTPYNISSFGQDEHGGLYLADRGSGRIIQVSQVSVVTAPPFVSEGHLDGTIIESSENSGVGGGVGSLGQRFWVGDLANRAQMRALLSFNTASLPDAAVVTSARIRIKLSNMTSPDPFSVLGRLLVDVGVPRFGQGPQLERSDFQALPHGPARPSSMRCLSAGWYTAALPPASVGLINRTGRTQFRLRFALDDNNDAVANFAAFFSGDAATPSDRPVLIVQYYVP